MNFGEYMYIEGWLSSYTSGTGGSFP